MKVYGGVDVQIHIFMTLVLVGGEWLASRLSQFTSGERAPPPPNSFDRRLDGLQSRSRRCGEEKILDSTETRTSTHRSSSP
jgi:hypothetical protein